MKVTPLDIRRKEFRRSVRGYLDEDVDIFLDVVADEVEQLSKANAELEAKVRSLEEQSVGRTNIGEALEKTLVAAQLQADEIKAKAEEESQSMLREAEAKAKTMVNEFYGKTQSVQETLMRLKMLEADFRTRFKGLLEGYITSLEEPSGASSPEPQVAGLGTSKPPDERAVVTPQPEGAGEADITADELVDTEEDETLEVGSATVQKAQTGQTGKTTQAGTGEREGSVFFGKKTEDLDDPFPEIGGAASEPRDFAW